MSANPENLIDATAVQMAPDFVLDHFAQVSEFAKSCGVELTTEVLSFATKLAQKAQDVAAEEAAKREHEFLNKVSSLTRSLVSVTSSSDGVAGYGLHKPIRPWNDFHFMDVVKALDESSELRGYRERQWKIDWEDIHAQTKAELEAAGTAGAEGDQDHENTERQVPKA